MVFKKSSSSAKHKKLGTTSPIKAEPTSPTPVIPGPSLGLLHSGVDIKKMTKKQLRGKLRKFQQMGWAKSTLNTGKVNKQAKLQV